MKKQYIQPQVKETMITLQQIIAVSGLGIDSGATPVNPSNADAKDDILEDWTWKDDFDW